MIAIGTRLRDRETGEVSRVTVCTGGMIFYEGTFGEGKVALEQLHADFSVLEDPVTRQDIEAFIRSKLDAEEAGTGLYHTGIAYVVVDRVDGQVTFQWFGDAIPFDSLLADQ